MEKLIWILGGDRQAKYKSRKPGEDTTYYDVPEWQAMAKRNRKYIRQRSFLSLIIFQVEQVQLLNKFIREEWLDINTFQSGHGSRETPAWGLG